MQGLMTIFHKELADYFTSWRGIILFVMVLVVSAIAVIGPSGAIEAMRADTAAPSQFAFLELFSQGSYPVTWRLSMILIPIMGIVLGLDAINREKNSGTLSRLLSQPIYRDSVINGKFLAGLTTMIIMTTTTILVITGIGMIQLGIPPTSEEAARLLLFWGSSILYGAFWLGMAMVFSVYFRSVAASAVAAIVIWIFFFFYTFTGFIAGQAETAEATITAMRVSPIFLFQESMGVILVPGARTLTEFLRIATSTSRFLPGPLSLGQSLLTIWPHLAIIGGLTASMFAISYTRFMREEIRST